MSDDANQPLSPPAAGRRRRPRLRAYFDTWLVATFVVFAFVILWRINDAAEQKHPVDGLGNAFVVAPLLALLTLPTLWLVRLFRERSPSTWLRFVRRLLLGTICGTFPAALLAALTAHGNPNEPGNVSVIWVSGIVFGLIAGLIDAMHLDAGDEFAA